MKRLKAIILGVLVIALGTIWGLNLLEITDINLFFDGWWTLFIIVPCLLGLITDQDKVGNLIGLAIGILLLLSRQNVLGDIPVWKLILPLLVVGVGLNILLHAIFPRKKPKATVGGKTHSAIFGGEDIRFGHEPFEGCTLTAIFGGIELDLRDAVITEDVTVDATAIFGGVDITLPDNVKVKVSATSVLGGVDNKTRSTQEDAPTVHITGTCVFGGIDLK